MSARVLQVLGRSAGGIARHVADITSALGTSFEIDIAGPADLPVAMPKRVVPLDIPSGPWGHGGAIRRLSDIVAEGKYSLIHAHGLRAGIDSTRATRGEVRVLVTVHNLIHPAVAGRMKALLYGPAERLLVRRADRILAVSRDIARHLAGSAGDDAGMKIEVLHLGVEEPAPVTRSKAEVRAELGLNENDKLVVTASRLSAQKAVHVMLEAIARVEAHLAIAGEGPLEDALRAQATASGLDGRVHFLGFRSDVADLISAADAFCLSSVWEGVPLAAMEALQLGTPVVATDVGGTGELIEDGVSGRLVPDGDAPALGDALNDVLDNPPRAKTFVEAGRAVLASEFNRDRMLERLAELYREMR